MFVCVFGLGIECVRAYVFGMSIGACVCVSVFVCIFGSSIKWVECVNVCMFSIECVHTCTHTHIYARMYINTHIQTWRILVLLPPHELHIPKNWHLAGPMYFNTYHKRNSFSQEDSTSEEIFIAGQMHFGSAKLFPTRATRANEFPELDKFTLVADTHTLYTWTKHALLHRRTLYPNQAHSCLHACTLSISEPNTITGSHACPQAIPKHACTLYMNQTCMPMLTSAHTLYLTWTCSQTRKHACAHMQTCM